jgi:hypothetical protein
MTPRARACRAFGLDPTSTTFLGRGLFGEAWATPRRTVLKVTADPQEIEFIRLSLEMPCPGVPKVYQGPLELEGGQYAYEREKLEDLPWLSPSLRGLNVIARSLFPMPPQERLRRYDEILFSEQARAQFPYVIEAMRRFRARGVPLWDCKAGNLGMRGTDVVIRDARTIDARALQT